MTKEKAYYQTFLVLEHLGKEEKELIPQELINEIKNNMEYDEKITIDTSIPFEKQKLDEKTWNLLDKVIKAVEKNGHRISTKDTERTDSKINQEIEQKGEMNETFAHDTNYDLQLENIKLKDIIKKLQKDNEVIPKSKELIEGYREVTIQKDEEIAKLKRQNNELYNALQKVPKIFRRMFSVDIEKLLEKGK